MMKFAKTIKVGDIVDGMTITEISGKRVRVCECVLDAEDIAELQNAKDGEFCFRPGRFIGTI